MPPISIKKVITVIAIVVFLSQVRWFIWLARETWLVCCDYLGPLQNSPVRYPLALLFLTLFWIAVFKILLRR